MNHHHLIKLTRYNAQRGAIALITGLVLLFLATIGTVYVTRTSVVDQRISSNIMRAKSAFEAAEAGLNFALQFLDVDGRDLNGNKISDRIDMLTQLKIFDSAGKPDDVSGDLGRELDSTDGYKLQAVWDNVNNQYNWSLPSNGSACDTTANIVICLEINNFNEDAYRVRVKSTGFSDDRLGEKSVTQDYRRIAPSPGNLNATHALITYGSVGVAGSMSVVNVFSNATIWAGNDVTRFGSGPNSGTFIHPDPDGPTSDIVDGKLVPKFNGTPLISYPAKMTDILNNVTKSSGVFDKDKTVSLGVDIIDNSPDLKCDKTQNPNCFFNNFMAGTPDFVKEAADYIITKNDQLADPDEKLTIPDSFIWVDARDSNGALTDFRLKNGTYGSPEKPILLVIDGNFDPQASPTIYGVVYVRGNVVGGGSGGGLVVGSLIVEGDDGLDGSGGMDIVYDPNVIGNAGGGDGRNSVTPIAGTWKDW